MTVIKLRTLDEVHKSLIPADAKLRFIDFESLVETHGTYHQFGKFKFMTDQDVLDLIRLTSVRRVRPSPPSPNDAGLMVFIGHPYDHHSPIFLGWAPLGQELDLLDRIKEGSQERVVLLNVVSATPDDVEAMKKRHKKSWRFGNWYGRTDALMEDIRILTDDPIEGEEDLEQLQEEARGEGREAENSRL